MSLESLSAPLPGESPAGEDCESEIQSQNFALMSEYLVERAIQKARERSADIPDLDEGETRNAAALREDGRRRLISLEGILKDVLKLSSVNVEQVGKTLRDKTSALLAQRGKDLRLVPHLGTACAMIDGLDGYLAACRLAATLLTSYPDSLFPLPDHDDPADVWQRANAISDLVSGDGICALLGAVVVIDAKQSGRLTLAELVGGVRGDMPVSEVSDAHLNVALTELGPDHVGQLLKVLRDIGASVADLVLAFDSDALATPRVAETFRRAASRIAAFSDDGTAAGDTPALSSGDSAPAGRGATRAEAGLRTREDARRTIQDVILLIEKLEPGHPAPLLLKRAYRLLGMSFFDIIKDMAPKAISDIELIAGTESSG